MLIGNRCGEEIRLLQRFVKEQRVAFYKILKKYKVCKVTHAFSTHNKLIDLERNGQDPEPSRTDLITKF